MMNALADLRTAGCTPVTHATSGPSRWRSRRISMSVRSAG